MGEYPEKVQQMYSDNMSKPGGQAVNTDLINSAVLRLSDGSYAKDLKNPFITDRLADRKFKKINNH